jgi:hypothetical protein
LASVEKRAELVADSAADLHDAARAVAQSMLNATDTSAVAQEAQKRSAALTIDLLKRAVAAGLRDAQRVAEDNAFAALRQRADFQEILAAMQKSPRSLDLHFLNRNRGSPNAKRCL